MGVEATLVVAVGSRFHSGCWSIGLDLLFRYSCPHFLSFWRRAISGTLLRV